MPADRSKARQDPVSCESCRKKKLKCDRHEPCSNCQVRQAHCVYQASRDAGDTRLAVASDSLAALQSEHEAIKSRLQRLEDVVLKVGSVATHSEGLSHGPPLPTESSKVARPARVLLSPPSTQLSTPDPAHAKGLSYDYRSLERVGPFDSIADEHLVDKLIVRVEPLSLVVSLLSAENACPSCQVLLPQREETLRLFELYLDHLDHLQHVIHCPTIFAMIEHIYENSATDNLGYLALLLSILTSIATYLGQGECEVDVFNSSSDAATVAFRWLKSTLDVLETARRTMYVDQKSFPTRIY